VKQALIILAVAIVFGILVPLYKGFGFLDARIIAAYGFLALLFVAPASADLARTSSSGAILTRLALIVAWGWGITLLIFASAIITLNLLNRGGGLLAPPGGLIAPPPVFLASVLVFSLSGSIAIAALGAVLARRFSGSAAKNILRTVFLVILLGLAFGARVLPDNVTLAILDRFNTRRALTHLAWEGSLLFAVLAAALFPILLKSRHGRSFANIPMAENPDEGGR